MFDIVRILQFKIIQISPFGLKYDEKNCGKRVSWVTSTRKLFASSSGL